MKQLEDFDLSNRSGRYQARLHGFDVPKLKEGGGLKYFWSLVAIGNPDECWPFSKGKVGDGYGRYNVSHGKSVRANRMAWMMYYDIIPDGLNVLHSCDNPCCCNPRHLFLGTHVDNVNDRHAKGRDVRGEKVWTNKLSEADARLILESKGKASNIELAARFAITRNHVNDIWRRKCWKHL